MNPDIEEIIKIFRDKDPDHSDAYTEEWARRYCSKLNKTPAECIASMKAQEAELKSIDYEELAKESEKKRLENPEYYDYYVGHVNDAYAELRQENEEKNNVDSKK